MVFIKAKWISSFLFFSPLKQSLVFPPPKLLQFMHYHKSSLFYWFSTGLLYMFILICLLVSTWVFYLVCLLVLSLSFYNFLIVFLGFCLTWFWVYTSYLFLVRLGFYLGCSSFLLVCFTINATIVFYSVLILLWNFQHWLIVCTHVLCYYSEQCEG